MKLNAAQTSAVKYIEGPLLVLAGAGSGKTRVITEKINYLITHCSIPARHIIAVTFTNKAAREMQERVNLFLKKPQRKGLNISTFHTLGLKIIRHERRHLQLKSGFSLFDDQDTKALLGEIMHKQHEDDKVAVEEVQNYISGWKNGLITPELALNQAANPQEMLAATIYKRYIETLKIYNATDFDDLILLPVLLFRDNRPRLEYWQKIVRYLLVDECQDTNNAQYELIKQLTGLHNRFTLVGDDDQSIYAWRGARPENMAALKEDYPGLHVVKLEQNYRSSRRILKAANQLIANNPHVFDKQLWSDLDQGEKIRVVRCKDEETEAERIATEILTHRLRHNTRYCHYAILYRSNHLARLIEIKLQEHQLPYLISGKTSFFSRAEVKDIMAYMRFLINPDDDNAFLRIINTPRREIGLATLEKLGIYAGERKISLYSACSELGLEQFLDKRYIHKLCRFTEWTDTMRQRCYQNEPAKILYEMVDELNYQSWLLNNSSSPKVAEKRMKNVHLLLESVERRLERSKDDDKDNETRLKEVIQKLILQDMLERQEEESDDDRIQLLTLHAAKGLEFPHVYIAGTEEEILPHRNNMEDHLVEEERRLLYVGITRAQQSLTFTLTATRKQFGDKTETTPSRFLNELDQQDLIYEGFNQQNCPEQQMKKGNDMLNLLKDSLDI